MKSSGPVFLASYTCPKYHTDLIPLIVVFCLYLCFYPQISTYIFVGTTQLNYHRRSLFTGILEIQNFRSIVGAKYQWCENKTREPLSPIIVGNDIGGGAKFIRQVLRKLC